MYGQLGAKTSSVYMKKIAACTTSIGRQRITVDAQLGVKEWAKNIGYEEPDIIYGDTDSVFIKFSRKNLDGVELKGNELLKHAIQCGIDAGKYVDEKLDPPQNLEYENIGNTTNSKNYKTVLRDFANQTIDVVKKKIFSGNFL